jgi:hypothetical protein
VETGQSASRDDLDAGVAVEGPAEAKADGDRRMCARFGGLAEGGFSEEPLGDRVTRLGRARLDATGKPRGLPLAAVRHDSPRKSPFACCLLVPRGRSTTASRDFWPVASGPEKRVFFSYSERTSPATTTALEEENSEPAVWFNYCAASRARRAERGRKKRPCRKHGWINAGISDQ